MGLNRNKDFLVIKIDKKIRPSGLISNGAG